MTPRQLTEDEINEMSRLLAIALCKPEDEINDVFRAQLVAAPVSPDQEPLFV